MKANLFGALVGVCGGIAASVCGFTFPDWRAIVIIMLPVLAYNLRGFIE